MSVMTDVQEDVVADKKGKGRYARPGESWVAVRLPDSARDRIAQLAEEDDRSLSTMLRRIVLEWLERDERERREHS